MSDLNEYYYNEQLKRYIRQFMAIFAGLQVSVGANESRESRMIRVPISYGSKDRVVAAIKSANTQNKMLRLPTFSAFIADYNLAPELRKGVGQTRRSTVMPAGGLFPDDMAVVEQRMPVPYFITMELGIWASNTDQHFQILEQILSLFDPTLTFQTSDDVFDWTRLSSVELIDIRPEENYPSGSERKLIQTTLTFNIPIYLSIPTDVHKRFVKDIFVRLGAIDAASNTPEEIILDLDSQGIEYDKWFSADDIDID